jgi:hypothetical protein
MGQSAANTLDTSTFADYVRELALAGLIKLIPLGTHDMVADALTKSLPAPARTRHREVMVGHQRFQPFYARSLRACYSTASRNRNRGHVAGVTLNHDNEAHQGADSVFDSLI